MRTTQARTIALLLLAATTVGVMLAGAAELRSQPPAPPAAGWFSRT